MSLRLWSGLMLVLWVAGFVVCQTECMARYRACHGASGGKEVSGVVERASMPSCHATHAPSDSYPASVPVEAGDAHDDTMACCCSAAVFAQASNGIPSYLPQAVLVTLALLPTDASAGGVVGDPVRYFHAHSWLNWTSKPELCLGPGIRSHAPPVSSFC